MINTALSANEASYRPPELNDPAFNQWVHKVTFRLLNLPPGSSDELVRRIILSEGAPSSEWRSAYMFMVATALESKTSSGE
jgi:hypothetical protein